jgi:hypothetical protein
MKKQIITFVVGSLIVLGAGCTQQTKIAVTTQPTNEAFVERRIAQPPSAPEHIPAPTPIQSDQ